MEWFNVILLIFALLVLGGILYIPYMIIHKIAQGMIRTTRKTYYFFVNEN